MCRHSWVDTGLVKTWCKYCDADGYWNQGKVIVVSSPPLNFVHYGIPITCSNINTIKDQFGISGILLSANIFGDIATKDCGKASPGSNYYTYTCGIKIPIGKPNYIGIRPIFDSNNNIYLLYLEVQYPTEWYIAHIEVSSEQVDEITKLLVDQHI